MSATPAIQAREFTDDALAVEVERVLAAADLVDALPMPDKRMRADWTRDVLAEACVRAGADGARLAREFSLRLDPGATWPDDDPAPHKAWRKEAWAAGQQRATAEQLPLAAAAP